MKKRKRVIARILAAIILVAVAVTLTLVIIKKWQKNKAEYVIAEEWMELLCNHTGCDVFELPEGYDDNDYADARLISITAFETIDEHKLKRLYGDVENYSEDDYYNLADEYNLLYEKKDYYTKDDCVEILSRYNEIYFDGLWLDDYCEIEYQDSIKNLDSIAVLQESNNYSVVNFSDNSDITEGDIIVFKDVTGNMRTGRVDSIDETGACYLSEPEMEDVLKSIDFSDIRNVTYQDIYASNKAYDIASSGKDNLYSDNNGNIMRCAYISNKVISHESTSEGMTFTLSVEENDTLSGNYLAIEMEDKNTGETVKYISPIELGDSATGSIEVDLSDIRISSDMTYFTFGKGEKYAEYRLEMDTSVSGALSLDILDDCKIPLFETSIPFEYGFVSIDFGVYIELTSEGEYKITANMPTNICVRHDKSGGLRMIKEADVVSPATFETEINGEALLSLNAEADLRVFFVWKLLGAKVKAGALGNGEVIERDNGMVCTDVSVEFPVIKGEAYIDGVFSKMECEFDIYSGNEENIWRYHSEYVPNVRNGRVSKCSYGNDELMEEYAPANENDDTEASTTESLSTEAAIDDTAGIDDGESIDVYGIFQQCHSYPMYFLVNTLPDGQQNFQGMPYAVTDNGDSYTVTGTIKAVDVIMKDTGIEGMDEGDTVTSALGTQYTVTYNDHANYGNWADINIQDEVGNIYYIRSSLSGAGLSSSFVYIYSDEGRSSMLIKTYENVSFKVPLWSALLYPSGVVNKIGDVELVDYQGMFMDDNGEIHSNDLPEDY